ncbi:polyprenyl synthetase family protein [Microbacterium sp. CIAB417]|uniref:polyprenyl synthetase family protein n=1 Tax=Microbacterium sp. CIAB417 TaxID=2860287 RepID=UPI001FABA5C9|nr:polyprenyl synthetase family protein [Microbacterium sp. CIAB417]
MNATVTREEIHEQVESRVRTVFEANAARSADYGEGYAQLWRSAAEHVLGGKLLRPRLVVDLHAGLLDGAPERPPLDVVIELAAAVEILHYAFLLHDDVIDGDTHRRGKPNLIGTLRSANPGLDRRAADHWATTGAVLMGDLLLSAVHQMFARLDLDADRRTRLLDLLDHTIAETVAGEYADVGLSDGVITPDLQTILTMTARKTATYTFEFPLRLAAVLAGAAPPIEARLAATAQHLGIAFQLQDDALSVFGDAAEHGKEPYSDLREGKETALIAYARMTSAWTAIRPGLGDPNLTADGAAAIRGHLRRCGAEAFVQQLVAEQIAAARAGLADDDLLLPSSARKTLADLISRIEGRVS